MRVLNYYIDLLTTAMLVMQLESLYSCLARMKFAFIQTTLT